ncbi:hypothetical protein AB833_01635 [Chromatiales bacterium (ex Bugula neritina AB1)]|nr:hypothetical protein AB833_01635 [Chromatiales bacterium (ex Bugula neritina AB1)]
MTISRFSGIASIALALIYLVGFVYFGGFWTYPATGSIDEKISYLNNNQLSYTLVYLTIYVVFGVVLAVLVAGVHDVLDAAKNKVMLVSSMFGVIWVGMVIAAGMIGTMGLDIVLNVALNDPVNAINIWQVVALITQSIGGGNELVGGLWVLLLSIAALRNHSFTKPLNYLGCLVGLTGISTVYPADVLTMVFGLSQIVWFVWLGVAMFKAIR